MEWDLYGCPKKTKIGLFVADKCSEHTFYAENGQAFREELPYSPPGSIGNSIFRNIWNIPLATDGWFVNFNFNKELPDVDFDLILMVCEQSQSGRFVKTIRKRYPNAMLVGYVKETHPDVPPKNWHRVESLFRLCDKIAMPYIDDTLVRYSEKFGKPVFSLNYPYNIEGIYNLFPRKSSSNRLLVACNSWNPKRGYEECLLFAKKIATEMNLTIVENDGQFSWKEWLKQITSCSFCLNMDKLPKLGQVPIECAIIGTPHVGGIADAAKSLWPESATNDTELLRNLIINKQFNVAFAKEKVEERHSFHSFRHSIGKLLCSNC